MRWCLCEGVTLVRVESSLHPWLYKQDLASCGHIALGISPPSISRERSTLVWEKCFIFIKSSKIAGSVAPSENEEDIYDGWSLPRPVCAPLLPQRPPRCDLLAHSSSRAAGHCGGRDAGARGTRGGGTALVCPFVEVAPAGIHEEVADCGELQAELLGDGDLQLFGGPVVLPEDCHECAPLQVREHQPGALRTLVAFQLALLLLLPLTGCRQTDERQIKKRRQVS